MMETKYNVAEFVIQTKFFFIVIVRNIIFTKTINNCNQFCSICFYQIIGQMVLVCFYFYRSI